MSISSVVVDDRGVIESDISSQGPDTLQMSFESDKKSCPTFAISVYEFAEPDQNRDQIVLVRFGFFTFTGSVRILHIFLHVSSSSVRFCQNVGSSSVRSVRFPFLIETAVD